MSSLRKLLGTIRFSVLVMLKMDCRTILRKTVKFERAEKTSGFAACEKKMMDYWLVWSFTSLNATDMEMCRERRGV